MAAYYNSDIAHCSGVDCPLCNKCDRVRVAETENHVEIIAVVRFDEGKFTANSIKSSVSFSLDYVFRERQRGCLSGEVIGNIYDKPHRMKGGAE